MSSLGNAINLRILDADKGFVTLIFDSVKLVVSSPLKAQN